MRVPGVGKVDLAVLPLLKDFYAPSLGDVHTRFALPLNDPRRKYVSKVLGEGILRTGYIWMQMALTDIWARFVRVKQQYWTPRVAIHW